MSENTDELARALEEMSGAVVPRCDNEKLVPSGRRPCPICGKTMHVERDFGIAIDVCAEHGVWLDLGELPAILARVRSGSRIQRSAAIRAAKRQGKVSGMLFGAWSLLWE
jgi:Zn-finger nucleic acid-binding protein